MEYLGFWVTGDDVKPTNKNASNKKNDSNNFSKIITSYYRFNEVLLQYVGKTLTYVSAFN